jgi:hypothetical protein
MGPGGAQAPGRRRVLVHDRADEGLVGHAFAQRDGLDALGVMRLEAYPLIKTINKRRRI